MRRFFRQLFCTWYQQRSRLTSSQPSFCEKLATRDIPLSFLSNSPFNAPESSPITQAGTISRNAVDKYMKQAARTEVHSSETTAMSLLISSQIHRRVFFRWVTRAQLVHLHNGRALQNSSIGRFQPLLHDFQVSRLVVCCLQLMINAASIGNPHNTLITASLSVRMNISSFIALRSKRLLCKGIEWRLMFVISLGFSIPASRARRTAPDRACLLHHCLRSGRFRKTGSIKPAAQMIEKPTRHHQHTFWR